MAADDQSSSSDQLDLHWSESSESSQHSTPTSLSPTQYANYSAIKKLKNHKRSIISLKVEFSKGPLIAIRDFTDDEDRNDHLQSMAVRYESFLEKEKKYLLNLDVLTQKYKMSNQVFAMYTNTTMKMAWHLCLSRRCYQQSIQYMLRFLGMTTPKLFSLDNIALLSCVCLRFAAKLNNGRFEATGDDKIKRNDFNPKYYTQLLSTNYSNQQFNWLEMKVVETLQFAYDDPTTYDFIVYELEMLLLHIPMQHRKYIQSIYLKPAVLLKVFQIVDHVLMDIDSLRFTPSLIASAVLKCCFRFEDWQQGVDHLLNPKRAKVEDTKHHENGDTDNVQKNENRKYIPRLIPATPSPISPVFQAKLSGQISSEQQKQECLQLVAKYLTIPVQYWSPPESSFEYEKTLRNNILTYQTWRQIQLV